MFKILGADNKEYGPVTADQLRAWVAEGRVTAATQVQEVGQPGWKPLGEVAALQSGEAGRPGGLPPSPRRGLAVTSLVLGILSVIGCALITALPAILCGHIAFARARRNPPQSGGRGLAMAGFILGYASLAMLPILAGLLLPALAKAKANAQRIACVNNMKQLGLAARIWSNDHDGKFPPDLASMSAGLVSPRVLICPADGRHIPATTWATFGPQNATYDYLEPGIEEKNAVGTVVFQCPIHGNTTLGDGSVQAGSQGAPKRWK